MWHTHSPSHNSVYLGSRWSDLLIPRKRLILHSVFFVSTLITLPQWFSKKLSPYLYWKQFHEHILLGFSIAGFFMETKGKLASSEEAPILGMVSLKMPMITILGHKQ